MRVHIFSQAEETGLANTAAVSPFGEAHHSHQLRLDEVNTGATYSRFIACRFSKRRRRTLALLKHLIDALQSNPIEASADLICVTERTIDLI